MKDKSKGQSEVAKDREGNFLGYSGTGIEVTKEVGANDELRRVQDQLYNAIEAMEDGFVLFDAEDRMVICNQRFREISREIADILKPGLTFRDMIEAIVECGQVNSAVKDKEAWLKKRMEQHLNPTGPIDQELSRGDWLRVIERKMADGSTVGLRIDITKEKREEEERRILSHALEQSPSMIFITDVGGSIEYVNTAFTKISGYTKDEVIGKNPRILKSGDTPPELYNDLWNTIKSGAKWGNEIKDRCKDGSTLWVYATISPVKNQDGVITHFVSMHEDITQRKEINSRERDAREQAEMANRAKSEFLANMSHELRTPLNAIIGFSDVLANETFGPLGDPKNSEYAASINEAGTHLHQIIGDILDISKIEANEMTLEEASVDVGRTLKSCLTMTEHRVKNAEVTLAIDMANGVSFLRADEHHLKQIVINLISNAIKFTPTGGEIIISARLDDNSCVEISVTDTGIGIADKDIKKVLQPFGQVAESLIRDHGGTGLGLPICKSLMDLHDGDLTIKSEVGKGTKVIVKFPPERTIQM